MGCRAGWPRESCAIPEWQPPATSGASSVLQPVPSAAKEPKRWPGPRAESIVFARVFPGQESVRNVIRLRGMNIEITPKRSEGLERFIEVKVPVETVADAENRTAKKYASSVRLPA